MLPTKKKEKSINYTQTQHVFKLTITFIQLLIDGVGSLIRLVLVHFIPHILDVPPLLCVELHVH